MVKRRLLWIVVFVLLATAARLFQIQAQSIWFDEGWSAYAAGQPTLLAAAQADQTNPPLYYVLLNATGFGTSEFSLRVFSLLIGLLTIPLIERLARQVAHTRDAGLLAALLAAISTSLWWASQEARMYSLLALLSLIAALAWQQIINRPTRGAWIALWLSELALLYTHNTGPVAALWLNVAALLVWIARQRSGKPHFDWRVWIGGQIGVGLLWLPYFASRFLLLQGANSAITSAPQISLPLLAEVWAGFWAAPWALAISGVPILIVILALVLIVTLALVRRKAFWLFAHVLILTAGLVAGLIVLGNDLHGRYLVMVVPLLLAAVGVGIGSLRSGRWRALALTPFVLLFVVDLVLAQNPDYQHDDARGMVQYYAEYLSANDSVIDWSYADRYDLAYYWDRLGVKAKRITLPEGADLDAVLPLLPRSTSGDVALNVWYTQRADYRGMMGCVLGNGTVDEPDEFTTYGMSTLVYHHPLLNLPQLQPTSLTFTDSGANPIARVTAIGRVQTTEADQALCLPIQMTLLRATKADLKAALIVQNDLGWTVTSADAIFATANERTSASLKADETLTAYPLVRLPYGAPAGSYRVFLRLYDETENPSGYNPPQSGQTISGRDVLLATWTATQTDWTKVKRTTDLPVQANGALPGGLTLLADNLPKDVTTLSNGDEIRAALLWKGTGALPDVELADEGGAWKVDVPSRLKDDHGTVTLDWRSIRVPPDAPSGSAVLRMGGTVLAHYQITALPLLSQAPAFAQAVNAVFAGVGELVGYTLSDAPFSRDNPPQVTLIWHAGEQATAVSYTVTAQLVNATGQVIAQNDSLPGGRATTGWRTGEYIVDGHTLAFNDAAAAGEAKLVVALYDAETGNRVRLTDGTDAVTLVTGIEVR